MQKKRRFTAQEIEEMNRKQLEDLAVRQKADQVDAEAQKAGKMAEKIKQRLRELNPNALVVEGLDAALVGYAENDKGLHVAVYSKEECLKVLVEYNAQDYDIDAVAEYAGDNGPIFVK